MLCSKLHNSLDILFQYKDSTQFSIQLKNAYISDQWDKLLSDNITFNKAIEHASQCSDCLDDIFSYLEIKDKVNYHDFPCLHIAYYSTIKNVKCIDNDHGYYFLILNNKDLHSIGIGSCPWCGVPFPTTSNDKDTCTKSGLKKWQTNQLKMQLDIFAKSNH